MMNANSLLGLSDKVCIVTGATRGIGLASAEIFAASGAQVILVGRNEEELIQRVSSINRDIGSDISSYFICDVSSDSEVKDLFQFVFKRYKRLDVLLSNAGIMDDALLGMINKVLIDRVFSVNTYGVLYCAQYASRLMARGGGGSIINIASIIGTNGNSGQSVYSGSKSAVLGITKSLAKELASSQIRVNAISPGFIETDLTKALPAIKRADTLASIAMKRIGTPEDVAKVALFLASDLSTYVTGQCIGVDGGMLI